MHHGTRVTHSRFGPGVVVQQRWKGLEVLVRFDNGVRIWIRTEELTFQEREIPSEPTPQAEIHPPAPLSSEQLKARIMIEAFRLGIVPRPYVEEFTFGRESELQRFTEWLTGAETAGTFVVKGQYGSGKTHLIEFLTSAALKWNFAVAKVEFDVFEAPPHQPKRVYEQMIRSFRYLHQGVERDFRHFMREVARRDSYVVETHEILGSFLDRLNNIETELLWDWIEGLPAPFQPKLYDHTTAANIYSYLLSGLGVAALKALNLRGLLLLCDEAETVNFGLQPRHVERGIYFVMGLIYMSQNDLRLLSEDIRLENITPTQRVYLGAETKLIYHGMNRCRFLYQNPSGVKIVFAFTPIEMIDTLAQKLGLEVLELERPSASTYRQLFDETYAVYIKAYPGFHLTPEKLRYTFDLVLLKTQETLRLFIKGTVEALDLLRHYPARPFREFLG